jgi:hypothetical protein
MPFKLAICELHIPDLHRYMGFTETTITSHYMITSIIGIDNFYNDGYKDDISILKECYLMWLYPPEVRERSINIPEYFGNVEMVAIIKTFWLRLIQRIWKRIFRERKNIIRMRKLFYKWSKGLQNTTI